jgi:hypothetical protein
MPQIKDNSEHLTIIQKAEFTLSQLVAANGQMLPGQARKFIQLLIKKSTIMPTMKVYGMVEQKVKLNEIRFGSRVLKAGTPGTALPSGDRVTPDLSEVELDSQLFKCEVIIEEEVFEDNIEQAGLRNTIMQMLGQAISRDVEWIIINGDTISADPALAKLDGILKQTTSHTVAAGSVNLNRSLLVDTKKELPSEYRVDPRKMRYWTSMDAEEDYSEHLGDRQTGYGDEQVKGAPTPIFKYSPVQGVPEWPEDYGGADTTAVVHTDPQNVHVGIHTKIRLRVTEDVQAGNLVIVGKIRFDVKYENEDAAVKLTGVSVA